MYVELNRAILKNVGKRMANKYSSPLAAALYDDVHESQQRQQQMQHLQPYDYELIPTTLIFDYLQQQQQQQQRQQPWLPYESSATPFDNNYINNAFTSSFSDAEDETGEENGEQDMMVFNGVLGNNEKHSLKHIKQSNDGHSSPANEPRETLTFEKSINSNSNRNDDTKRLQLINNHQLHHHKNDLNLDLNDANPISSNPNANDFKNEVNDNNGDYQIQRYLYHLHKNQNHLTRK
ncbi:hypothetical protein CVS40_10079 [Lucilia cuprina]|nr:hypothetical protein CVS40_10079 [Lucilia cuprina]